MRDEVVVDRAGAHYERVELAHPSLPDARVYRLIDALATKARRKAPADGTNRP